MAIKATQVKELRDRSGVGMMDCKKALQESGGDIVILPFDEGCSTSLILEKLNSKK